NNRDGAPRHSGMSHFGLSVSDLDQSIAFYRDVLGAVVLREPWNGDSPSFSGRMALVRVGSFGIDLYQHASNTGERFEPARTGLDHFAFVASTLDELEAWASWLDERAVARSPIRDAAGIGSIFDFTDPDGIQIEFFFVDQERLRSSSLLSNH